MIEAEISSRLPSVPRQAIATPADDDGLENEQQTVVGPLAHGLELRRLEMEETAERPSADLADAPTVSTRDKGDEPSASETLVAERAKIDPFADEVTADRLPADEEPPTLGRPSGAPPSMPPLPAARPASVRPSRPIAPEAPAVFEAERPASRWLDEPTAAAYRVRAAWLEEEARAAADPTAQARELLAVSELYAIANDMERAVALAVEARDLAPHLPLAWRQSRQLLPRDVDVLVEALDGEAAGSPTAAARAHATLLAADVLRVHGQGDAAVERWESATKLDPADVRAPVARAVLALAQDEYTSGALFLSENSELIALDKAVSTALRLRGHPRAGAEGEPTPINDGLRKARMALAAQDVVATAHALQDVAAEPELAKAALWLSASFGCAHIAGRRGSAKALKTLANDGEGLARRALAARGIELADPELVTAALTEDAPIDVPERAVLLALAGQDPSDLLPELAGDPELAALVDALSAMTVATDEAAAIARSKRVSGKPEMRAEVRLGRLLASRPSTSVIDAAVSAVATDSSSVSGVALEAAVRAKRWSEVSQSLSALPAGGDAASSRHVAAALVAERANDRVAARRGWREAVNEGLLHDGIVRIAASVDPDLDLSTELLRIADEQPDGPETAVLRLEALARTPARPEHEQATILERVHRSAPGLGIGAFLAERIGRRRGDLDEVLRWIQERRATATDPLEIALDAVREALLVADRDAELASTRLEEAHRARPDDVALRELYERLASEPPSDRGAWREARASSAHGSARAMLYTEAALEHEQAGDAASALRASKLAVEAGDKGLAPLVVERAELALGQTERAVQTLTETANGSDDAAARREALVRLAELALLRDDVNAAVEHHQRVLEEDPKDKPSLRAVEHALITAGADEELEPIVERISLALDGTHGGEVCAHAQLAARLRMRRSQAEGGGWERTRNMARLAATQPEPSLWALRALNAHARHQKDEPATLKTTIALLERTQRPAERAALLLRASEAAALLEHVADARAFLEQAASEDPGDVVTWGFLAEVRERAGETRAAAEACESLARTSVVPAHQLLAWCDAAKIWLDEVKDSERGMAALEAAAEIDASWGDVFPRLSALYAEKHLDSELARLLEKRLEKVEDEEERVAMEVDLARALADLGELAKAKAALANALAQRPDHTTALGALAEVCTKEADWNGAEQAYVRLARLLNTNEEQAAIYAKLAELYAVHLGNLSRAEVAYKELLKRTPNDLATLAKLVEVYKRQGDVSRAVETQQQIVAEATDPKERLQRLIELAAIHESAGRDPRKAEQVLDSARKEFPTSVVALRAMAELYMRQRQMPAMQILLDRAASDARRAFAQGRFVPALFEVLHAAFDLRGKKDAARVVAATLAAIEGQPSSLVGADAHAIDPRLDDVLAPELLSPSLRALLARAGDALDVVAPLDLRSLRATPLVPGSPIGATVGAVATVVGLGAMQVFVSPALGRVAIPLSSNPPTLLVGEGLAEVKNEHARAFVVMRAMKMILARSSALVRGQADDVNLLVAALFTTFNPSFVPQGVDTKRVQELSRRIGPALPRNLDPTIGVIALEAAGILGTQGRNLSAAANAWASRVALVSVGDPNAALDGLAWGRKDDAAPKGSEERAAWVARTPEARDLMAFSVSEAYAEARARLGLDR
jgi:tetratricopeptide (TPR) repeat protein